MENKDKTIYKRRLSIVKTKGDYNVYHRILEETLRNLLKDYPWYNELTTTLANKPSDELNLQIELKTKDDQSYFDLRDFLDYYPHGMEESIGKFIINLFDSWCYRDIYDESAFLIDAKIALDYPYNELFTLEDEHRVVKYQSIRPSFMDYFREKIMSELVDSAPYKNAMDEIKGLKITFDRVKVIIEYMEPINQPFLDNDQIDSKINLIQSVLEEIKKICYWMKLSMIAEYTTTYF